MFYRSERLFLRPAWPEDWSDIWRGIIDEEIETDPSAPLWTNRREDAREFFFGARDPAYPQLVLTEPGHGGVIVGYARLEGCDRTEKSDVHLRCWIAPPFRGQGYATEAIRALVHIGRMLGHERIAARHYFDNAKSGEVLRQPGLRAAGGSESQHCTARSDRIDTSLRERDLRDSIDLPQRAA